MISLAIYIALVVVAIAMSIYCFVDWKNRVYGNVIVGFLATIIFFYVAVAGLVGEVQDIQMVQNQSIQIQVVNESTNISISSISYTYDRVSVPLQDASISWLWVMCGLVMSVVTGLFCIEIFYKNVVARGGR